MSKVTSNPNMYAVGGDVQASGGIYIPRDADDKLLALCRSGTFSFVLTPRQMGKSSLMKRTAERLAEEDVRTVIIDLTQIGTNVSAEQWYLGLLSAIEEQLVLKTDALRWWDDNKHLGMTQRLTDFFRKVMMREVARPVVIFIDELDTTLSLNFTDDFYAAIRYLHNARDQVPEFKRLSFVLIGVATPSDLVRDPQRTPFNIGQRVDLTDFTPEEARPLAAGLGLPKDETQRMLDWMLEWTNGHPYLTLRLCRAVAMQTRDRWTREEVERIVKRTFFNEQSEQDNNLQFVRDMLTERAPDRTAVMTTYLDVLRGRVVYDEEQSLIKSHLKLSGVVYRDSGVLRVRNRIYREAFDTRWVKEHLPQTLRRRLRRTAIVSGATTTLAFIGLLLIPLTFWALQSRTKAVTAATEERRARREAEVARADALAARAESEKQQLIADQQRALAETLAVKAEERRKEAEYQTTEAQKQREIALGAVSREQLARQQAEVLRREAQARQLGAFAELTRNQQARLLKRSVLLAQESMQVPSEIGYQALNRGLALLPRPVARLEQPLPVSSLAFAADGGSIVTFGNPDPSAVSTRVTGSWTINRGAGGDPAFTENKRIIDMISPSMKYELEDLRVIEVKTRREIGKLNVTFPSYPPIFSPDSESQYVLFTSDDTALVFEMATARLAFKRSSPSGKEYLVSEGRSNFGSYVACFSATGKYLAITTIDGKGYTVHVLESANGAEVTQLHLTFQPLQILFSPDEQNKFLAIIGTDHSSVRLWELATHKEVARVFHKGSIETITFSPDGQYLATAGGSDNTARVWETATGRELAHLTHEDELSDVAFSPDGQYLVTASSDATARVWDWQQGSEVTRMIHEGPVTAVAFDPMGEYVATASSDKTARVWEFAIGSNVIDLKRRLKVSEAGFTISPTGNYVAATGRNGVRLLDPNSGRDMGNLHIPDPALIFTNSSGRYLAAITEDDDDEDVGYIQWWDTQTGTPVTKRQRTVEASDEAVIAISPDGNYFIVIKGTFDDSESEGELKIVNRSNGREVSLSKKGKLQVGEFRGLITFSPDSRFFVVSFETSDNKETVWAYQTQTGHGVLIPGVRAKHLAAFSSDSKYFATTSAADNTIKIWSTETWQVTATLSEHKREINQIVFSADHDLLVTASRDNTAVVWGAAGGRWEANTVKMLKKVTHEGEVTDVAFSHDSKYLATTSADETTRVWALDSAREVARVTDSDKVIDIAFSSDDKVLVISTHHSSDFFDFFDFLATDAQLWLWSPEALFNETCARLIPNLTLEDWQQYEEWHKATIGQAPLKTCNNLPSAPSKQ